MNDLDKLKRHLGRPVPIKLKNDEEAEDVFYFKPLNVEQQAVLMEISKRMNNSEKIVVEGNEVPNVSKEDMNEMFDLILDICKSSFKDVDDETLNEFANANFNQIFDNLDKLMPNKTKDELDKIKKRKEITNEEGSK